jgi:hypothetical protein|tara:strand:+ start:24 stop:431 length:408 start_codon:yes stop_codon:yes gene_type:complete
MGGVKSLWEDAIHEVIENAVHGVLTKKEAKKKLERLIDIYQDGYPSDELQWIEEEMGDIDEPVKFKSLNVHENVYGDLKEIAKEDNRTIAATVALLTSKARYDRRRQRYEKSQQEMQELFGRMDKGYKGENHETK